MSETQLWTPLEHGRYHLRNKRPGESTPQYVRRVHPELKGAAAAERVREYGRLIGLAADEQRAMRALTRVEPGDTLLICQTNNVKRWRSDTVATVGSAGGNGATVTTRGGRTLVLSCGRQPVPVPFCNCAICCKARRAAVTAYQRARTPRR